MDSLSPSFSSSSSSSSIHQRQACKQYRYVSEQRIVTVKVLELLDADFGLYVWPSALVLAEYIFHRLDMFTGSVDNPKVILELGAGTALPSLLIAKATPPGSTVLITTDRPYAPHIIDNIHRAYKENDISWTTDQHPEKQQHHRIVVRPLGWGDFTMASPHNPDGGLLQLLNDVSGIEQVKERNSRSLGRIDLILGSDTFYNPPDFEPLLATVSFIINRHNPDCVFLTTYQNRSAKRNISHLLEKWGLEGRVIEWEAFGFDMNKFVTGSNTDGTEGESFEQEQELNDEVQESEGEEEQERRWLKLAKEEVERAMSVPEAGLPRMPGLALVDYSSGSDFEDGDATDIDDEGTSAAAGDSAGVSDHGHGQGDYNHKMGDGGSLSSVHFLWISATPNKKRLSMNSDAPEEGNAFWAQKSAIEQRYQAILDKATPHTKERWAFTGLVLVIYFIRVFIAQGWYIVTYALGIYLLNLFLAFLQPKIDPSLEMDMEADSVEEGGPVLPTRSDDEFRPFVRRLPEFKFWHSATRSIVIAFFCTLFRVFDIPVFWPILLVYFCILFTITMKRQIKHMIKYRYIPFNIGKKSYGGGNKSFS
ncbi:hypothetical protein EC991_000979 [Linnemannia zychae]|nr:hypothetical protein EC991_000979 [Linnemannia zychae]